MSDLLRFRTLLLTPVFMIAGCSAFIRPSYEYDDVTAKRISDQSYFEDSLKVFFVEYPNPYRDKEVLWFASFLEGEVEMRLHDMTDDSLVAVYRFEPQTAPIYPIAYRADRERPVKCVILVDGRPKCATQVPWLYPLPVPQWGTRYTVKEFRE